MPGFDGTGPTGQGPMTGGGRGFCAMPNRVHGPYGFRKRNSFYSPSGQFQTNAPLYGAGRGGTPWGGGLGRAFGGGRGFWCRWW